MKRNIIGYYLGIAILGVSIILFDIPFLEFVMCSIGAFLIVSNMKNND